MQGLVEYVARSIVDNPDEVEVIVVPRSRSVVYELRVAPEDKGWVIGRRGRVANALRALLRVASAQRGKHANLEII